MRRTQPQLEERSRAYSRGVPMASVIREALSEYLATGNLSEDFAGVIMPATSDPKAPPQPVASRGFWPQSRP